METQTDWSKPQGVTGAERAFGGGMERLLPAYDIIPKEFKNWNNKTKWGEIQSTWFYCGLPKETVFKPKDGITTNDALNHLASIQGSFQPKHEHKTAAVAWLMSLWFDDIVIPEGWTKKRMQELASR